MKKYTGMIFRLLNFVLFYLLILSGFGQTPTFTYVLSTPQNEKIVDVIENEFGEFICVGFISEPGSSFNYQRRGLILKLNANGELIDSTILMLPDKSYKIHNIIQDAAGKFITVEIHRDTTAEPNSELVLKRFNYSLEVLNSDKYEIYYPYVIVKVYPSIGFNNDILISAKIWDGNSPFLNMLSIRFDQSFELIHSKMEYYASGNGVKQLNDSSYWFLVGLDYGSMFLLTDTLFNALEWQYAKDPVYSRVGIKWDTDSSFYMSSTDDGDIMFIRQFHPLDTTGRLLNSWGTIDTSDVTANNGPLDFHNKDSIYIGGTTNSYAGGPYPPSYFSLIQTDSSLQVRWEKFFGGDAYYEMNRVIATKDGGCLMAGTVTNVDSNSYFVDNDVVIIKVNSQGIIVGSSESLSDINSCEAIIYPNPGDDVINVRIAAQYKESVFELYDMNGRIILKQSFFGNERKINTSFIDNGTYVYIITSEDGLFESGKWIKN